MATKVIMGCGGGNLLAGTLLTESEEEIGPHGTSHSKVRVNKDGHFGSVMIDQDLVLHSGRHSRTEETFEAMGKVLVCPCSRILPFPRLAKAHEAQVPYFKMA